MKLDDPMGVLAGFGQSMSIADWINTAILAVLIVTMLYTARGVRLQAKASDFSSYILLVERLSKAWRAYGDARTPALTDPAARQKEEFEFLELMNILEMACHLSNNKVLGPTTREMLRDHLKEVLPKIFDNSATKQMIGRASSGPDTFFHIRRFAREHRLKDVPQQQMRVHTVAARCRIKKTRESS